MILKALFAIPQCQIDSDIAAAEKLPGRELQARLASASDKPAGHVWTAQEHHAYMVVVKACQDRPKVPYEYRVYLAVLGAERIVGEVRGNGSHSSPDCPEHEIERRERLMGATILSVLRRYRLDDLADLYGNEREQLEAFCARGRRIACESATEE